MAPVRLLALASIASLAAATRTRWILDDAWKFELASAAPPACPDPINTTFPLDYSGQQCDGLTQVGVNSQDDCAASCCADNTCQVWQWCTDSSCSPAASCWTGTLGTCTSGPGWVSRARKNLPPPPPNPGQCTDPRCEPGTDDSTWRVVDLPHDFVVEGNFSQAASKSGGYLPGGVGWYRKHFTPPAAVLSADVVMLQFDAAMQTSTVWLNGNLLGTYEYGFTPFTYWLNASSLLPGDNVIAVELDATNPDGAWWYAGGGISRHVWLTAISTPGPYIATYGVYAPSNVTGAITWRADGTPVADSAVVPEVQLWSNATSGAAVTASIAVAVIDAAGNVVVTGGGSASVPPGGDVTWVSPPLAMPGASLWHLVSPPAVPALYTLATTVSVGGTVIDAQNVTFGVRATYWDASTGFWLNGVHKKILGCAQHEDVAAWGIGFPDHVHWARVAAMKSFSANGWRTAHNMPNPALLDATDSLGYLVWDESHRNGQPGQTEILARRDRNHPSVIIWSVCNEILCNTDGIDWVTAAQEAKAVYHTVDHASGRPVSANQNGWIGPNTPLDVQGFDYSTGSYDGWHKAAPNIPSISSETSSAVSDRGEYANDPNGGHVEGYDRDAPGWGQTAQGAWGGIGESNGQGILTRDFISGGWTWTGMDYRGEPTPYGWPDVNSHFGILDLAMFPKDRTHWYMSWFPTVDAANLSAVPVHLHVFPPWEGWTAGQSVSVWAFSNADAVELFVNDVSAGVQNMTQYAHVEWAVPFAPGNIRAVAYRAGVAVATMQRNTTGAPAAVVAEIKDGWGAQLVAGCKDFAFISAAIVDASGQVVHTASNDVTFTVSGPATLEGTSNGDPASLVNNKSPTRPAYHGLVLGAVNGPPAGATGPVVVTVSSPGLTPATVTIPVVADDGSSPETWCHREQRL